MPRSGPGPIRRSPRRPSGSAAPGPTSKASCGGWSRPSQKGGEPRGRTRPLVLIGGRLGALPRLRALPQPGGSLAGGVLLARSRRRSVVGLAVAVRREAVFWATLVLRTGVAFRRRFVVQRGVVS